MYVAELEKVRIKLQRMIKKKCFDKKEIYLFGVSDNTRQIIKILRENGIEPGFVADNDAKKIGSHCLGLQVVSVERLAGRPDGVWLMYSYYWREMRAQLLDLGVEKKSIYSLCERKKTIWNRLDFARKGKKLYGRIIQQYGEIPVFLCPYTGTGDIYLIGTFWQEYIKQKEIKEYVFVVISTACKKVAALFDIQNVLVLKQQKEAEYLISYYNLCPDEAKIKLLNDAWAQINDNSSEWFRGYKGLYFTELFRKWVFELPEEVNPKHPVLKNVDSQLEEIFVQNSLIEGKTVVLSPYSNTLGELPFSFWEQLSDGLQAKGYKVCTNSSGECEPVIKGSQKIFFSLDIAPQFLNKAGGFIGARSGFCDIISGSDAKKVILYNAKDRFYNCSAYEYFSLKGMGLCDAVTEIEIDESKMDDYIKNILELF